jgi:AraC-like DNA-binding protein/mannose-6-phosphate isomerase-like protein (cupin superfamily)
MDKLESVMEKMHIASASPPARQAAEPFAQPLPAGLFALDSLARAASESVPGMTDISALRGISPTPIEPKMRYPLGLHTNPQPELCICLWGAAGMEIHDQRFLLKPGDVAYLHPGVVHSEGFISPRQGYQLLWLSVSPDGFGFGAVIRSPEGWNFPFRTAGRLATAPQLHAQLTSLTPGRADHFEQFRAIWLMALSCVVHTIATPVAPAPEHDPVRQMMLEVKDHIDHHLSARLSLAYLARYSGFTGTHLNRLFRKQFGVSVHAYVIGARLDEGLRLINQPGARVQEVARAVGYEDPLYFSKAYRAKFGRPPSQDLH